MANLLYWHWLVLGMALMVLELVLPSFTAFWFGLGAFIVGGALWLSPSLSLTWQLALWTLSSCIFTLLWFRYFRRLMTDRTKAGLSREAVIGETGIVVRAPHDGKRGLVRFTLPLLGDDEWEFIAADGYQVSNGERLVITDISGNTLVARPANGTASQGGAGSNDSPPP